MDKPIPGNQLKARVQKIFRNNNSILDECTLINLRRIFYLSLLIIPSRILHIYLFTINTTPTPKVWRQGIIFSHLCLLVFWIGMLIITYRLRDKLETNITMNILQYLVPIVTMASGVIIVILDQLITTNITPFLLSSIAVGTIFLLRPLISIVIYLMSYIICFLALGLTVTNPKILLSNRVNGSTAIAIGLLMSLMIWHYHYTNLVQKRHIIEQQKKLKKMAYYDQLTGLCNRHYFNQLIEKEFAALNRYGHTSAIIILDVDNFKQINDTFGHLVGDQVLQQLAQLLITNIRKCDTVSRFGGEEFIILAPQITLEDGITLAEKLRQLISTTAFITGPTKSFLTASFGVSLLELTANQRLDNYYSLADKALYSAKKQGKNLVQYL